MRLKFRRFPGLAGDKPLIHGHYLGMNSQDKWIVELASLAASSPQIPELVPLEVGFDVSGARLGLDLLFGRITDGSAASCWIAGTSEALSDLVAGKTTLQRAYLTGRVTLSGEPEGLLRLAFLLDAADALRKRQGNGLCANGCA
ncbi:MAG: hypothetical protein RIS36_1302 [Pseudomonadota bacterium]|jgi:hypothetical protein